MKLSCLLFCLLLTTSSANKANPSHGSSGGSDGAHISGIAATDNNYAQQDESYGSEGSYLEEGIDFQTSFEVGDPAPTWQNEVEQDSHGTPRLHAVTRPGIPGTVMDQLLQTTASAGNPGAGEDAAQGTDGSASTKWLTFASHGWLQVQLNAPVIIKSYALTSANDAPGRDPRAWTLLGSSDGLSWNVLDARDGESFSARFETHMFEVDNEAAYTYYRLDITQTQGDGILQIAEFVLSKGNSAEVRPMQTAVGEGPISSWNARPNAGFTGLRALRYAGCVSDGHGYSYNKVFEVDIAVTPISELSYLVFPEQSLAGLDYASTYVGVDLAFADGSYLSELEAKDQHHATMSPAGQGLSHSLVAHEWNRKVSRIGKVAAGKRITRILVGYDRPEGSSTSFGGWIDDLTIERRADIVLSHLSDYVLTTRGTNSSGTYSRGNNIPATAVPHGFNFWTPVTDARSQSWLYTYHRRNNSENLPELQAFSMSHEPSPWMGDRHSFQVMPQSTTEIPNAARVARALAFRHENEIARPYYYGVTFENGIEVEIAPTDHAAIFRFTFADDNANLVFDNVNNNGGLTLDAGNGVIQGFSDARSGLSAGATRIFIYATFDKPVIGSDKLRGGGGRNVTGYFRFKVDADEPVVTMRIASSLISIAQAKKNLELEIDGRDSFEDVQSRARALWDEKLGIIRVVGANQDELTTLYSNLYRLFLYPNSAFENTGTKEQPVYQYASPVTPGSAPTSTQTGAPLVAGKLFVNNGFWDTYRATWPALTLLTPTKAGEMIDGFLQQYRDGGWISRWSSPGYADLMTGTSSDVAFADAYLKGVDNFDEEVAYDAALRNATVVPPSGAVGRKGLATSIFRGYTPANHTGAAFSWAMAGYLNDFGIANMSAALAQDAGHSRHQEFAENAEYFMSRAQDYMRLFDPAIDFFQGRNANGLFRLAPGDFDPTRWGDDFTETNAWNMAFDTPHDGLGLANLYGGRNMLEQKLDEFFATPETASEGGGYGGVIHEMREARDVRMGQLGLSNQPAYHIPYMYLHASAPSKAQEKIRHALQRLWVGSDIGQGYLGDEDNGASSAWYLFSALGFYPLQVGSPFYVIGSPLFKKTTVHLENGNTIQINAPNNSPENIYVQSLKVNGQPHTQTYLSHDTLVAGATLDFVMGPAPSSWGTAPKDAPPSVTAGSEPPAPLTDIANGGKVSSTGLVQAEKLFDDTSGSWVTASNNRPSVRYQLNEPRAVVFYTITSGPEGRSPRDWTVLGSNDGSQWTVLDQRTHADFRWSLQTRAFKVAALGSYSHYRFDFTASSAPSLAEIELLSR